MVKSLGGIKYFESFYVGINAAMAVQKSNIVGGNKDN